MTDNETRERMLAAEIDVWGIDREQPLTIRAVAKSWFRNGWIALAFAILVWGAYFTLTGVACHRMNQATKTYEHKSETRSNDH